MSKPGPSRKISSQRLPPPALFQGPPSHNASNLSLPQPHTAAASGGINHPPPPLRQSRPSYNQTLTGQPPLARPLSQSKRDIDSAEAVWLEMQSALSEVELSTAGGEHVFGEKHSRALEDLRAKQLKLAQAWTRNEAEDGLTDSKSLEEQSQNPPSTRRETGSGTEDDERGNERSSSYKGFDKDTERDILLARERREANDRFFDRVNNGVLDVVAKLEEVAQAMRAVQRESRDIWSESDSMSAGDSSSFPN